MIPTTATRSRMPCIVDLAGSSEPLEGTSNLSAPWLLRARSADHRGQLASFRTCPGASQFVAVWGFGCRAAQGSAQAGRTAAAMAVVMAAAIGVSFGSFMRATWDKGWSGKRNRDSLGQEIGKPEADLREGNQQAQRRQVGGDEPCDPAKDGAQRHAVAQRALDDVDVHAHGRRAQADLEQL